MEKRLSTDIWCHSFNWQNEHWGLTNIYGNYQHFNGVSSFEWIPTWSKFYYRYYWCYYIGKSKRLCRKHDLVVEHVPCAGGLWAARVPHGRATMRRGGAVNGCDHSFLVNNAAPLIGWINNWWGRVWGGGGGGGSCRGWRTYDRLVREDFECRVMYICLCRRLALNNRLPPPIDDTT